MTQPTLGQVVVGAAPVADSGGSAAEDKPDRVSEASMESFPASDPPAWMSMRVGPPMSDAEQLDGAS